MNCDQITLRLEIDPRAEPISGALTGESGDVHAFSGLLGLIAALDEARLAGGEEGDSGAIAGARPGTPLVPGGRP